MAGGEEEITFTINAFDGDFLKRVREFCVEAEARRATGDCRDDAVECKAAMRVIAEAKVEAINEAVAAIREVGNSPVARGLGLLVSHIAAVVQSLDGKEHGT